MLWTGALNSKSQNLFHGNSHRYRDKEGLQCCNIWSGNSFQVKPFREIRKKKPAFKENYFIISPL